MDTVNASLDHFHQNARTTQQRAAEGVEDEGDNDDSDDEEHDEEDDDNNDDTNGEEDEEDGDENNNEGDDEGDDESNDEGDDESEDEGDEESDKHIFDALVQASGQSGALPPHVSGGLGAAEAVDDNGNDEEDTDDALERFIFR